MNFRPIHSSVRPTVPAKLDEALSPGTLLAVLQVFEATLSHDVETFEPFALRCLGRLIGFDGAVWGSGVVASGRDGNFAITHASVVDRPATLLDEYPEVAPSDPVTARFLARPEQPIAFSVEDYFRARGSAGVGEYLQRHRVAQLVLLGCNSVQAGAQTRALHWITAYRESASPFDELDVSRLQTLLPLWNQAHELCLTRHMERMARANPVEACAIALCDRTGLVHVAEPGFNDLTALRRGDNIACDTLARLRGPGRSAFLAKGICLRAHEAGAWTLLRATREGVSATLTQRERQVARHYVEGLSYKQIARELGSSPSTVRTQLQNVYRRLGVHSRTGLQRAIAHGPA